MTFLALEGRTWEVVSAASNCGKESPPKAARAPACRVSRRVSQSQQRRGLPSRRSMRPPERRMAGGRSVPRSGRETHRNSLVEPRTPTGYSAFALDQHYRCVVVAALALGEVAGVAEESLHGLIQGAFAAVPQGPADAFHPEHSRL